MINKILFLEYKFRDFVDDEITIANPTLVMCAYEKLNLKRIAQIKRLKLSLGVSFVFQKSRDSCPLDPLSLKFAIKQLRGAISLKPDVIWFDYLKFPGKWNVVEETSDYVIHKPCKYCKGADRQLSISEIARKLVKLVPRTIKTGVFTMPFMAGDHKNWEVTLGENFFDLGNIFDYLSPMLYHRMIKKPTSYIHDHVEYLNNLKFKAKIIPIIQLKDMPDNLEDKLTLEEFDLSVREAVKPPSSGIAVFSWDQAIEKDKLKGAGEILRSVD